MSVSLLALFAASAISQPTVSSLFMRKHFPRGETAITLLLDHEGKVVTCEVLDEDKSEDRKQKICEKMIGETAGNPAMGPDGVTVHGYVTGAAMVNRSSRRAPRNMPAFEPDFTLLVKSLPGEEQAARVGFLAFIDENGQIKKCRPFNVEQEELFLAACEQALRYQFPIARDQDGNPVGYVDEVSVGFEVDPDET